MPASEQIATFAKEQMIRASGLLSLLMPQTAGIGIAVKGLDGRYQLANEAMKALTGKGGGQIAGLADSDLFPAGIAAEIEACDRQIAAGAPAARIELDLSPEGVALRYLWLTFPVLGLGGEVLSIGVVMIDVSRQEAVSELRQSLHRLQQTNQDLQKTLLELDRLASTDKLTGAWNRRRLEDAVVGEMERLKRYDHPLSLLMIDIDFFKNINDRHGHGVGDTVLERLAALMQANLRATDSLTRWGGEEFVVLCPNTTLSTVAMLAERLRERIAGASFPTVGSITASIGVAECVAGEDWDHWLRRADSALYRAKACGRNQVQIAPETPKRTGIGENVAANFVQLVWHGAYECGNPVIDDQHRGLFRHANALLSAILSGRPTDELAALIDALIGDVVRHFADEETIITLAGFPGAADHAAIHRQLVDHALTLVGHFHAGTLRIGELFQFLAHDVVARHMLGADREFFPYLAQE